MQNRRLFSAAALSAAGFVPSVAYAQTDSPLITATSIPDSFDRGRNISVVQRARPEYDALGLNVASFKVYPRLDTRLGFTDNVYVSDTLVRSDAFVDIAPSFTASSDWSRHQVQLRGNLGAQRYFNNPRRNQNVWDVASLGRLDFGSAISVTGEAQAARVFEAPFSGEVTSDLAVLSSYFRDFFAVRAQYQSGQTRLILSSDRASYSFSAIPLSNGTKRDQSDRDRTILRGSAQLEYALTPSFSAYTQAQYSNTSYRRSLLSGAPNRDSDAVRVIGGVSFDLSGLMRGSIGVGYTRRFYRSPQYPDIGGVSVDAKLEYFPTELTTFTLSVSRVLQDASIGTSSAYFDNSVSFRADHELLRNLLIYGYAQYGKQNYSGITGSAKRYRAEVGGRYLVSRFVALQGNVSYGHQSTNNTLIGRNYGETRAIIGATFQL